MGEASSGSSGAESTEHPWVAEFVPAVDTAVAKERRLREVAEMKVGQLERRLEQQRHQASASETLLVSQLEEARTALRRLSRSRDYRIGRALLVVPRGLKTVGRRRSPRAALPDAGPD